jgi:isocitrate/isopropylmalate dehydrogenase
MEAVRIVIADGEAKTRDMGGNATTRECGAAIVKTIHSLQKTH